jgi:hypothetical protein
VNATKERVIIKTYVHSLLFSNRLCGLSIRHASNLTTSCSGATIRILANCRYHITAPPAWQTEKPGKSGKPLFSPSAPNPEQG